MKKRRINKIWSVGLTLTLLVAMLAFAAPQPVEAATGNMKWKAQNIPAISALNVLLPSAAITDIAIASDGTIYVCDNAASKVYKSTNGGQSFSKLTAFGGTNPIAIAVAPDDPEAIAVASASTFYTSNNGGASFATLTTQWGVIGGEAIDIAVAPARAGTLLSREYAVALADPLAGTATSDTGTNTALEAEVVTATWSALPGTYTITYKTHLGATKTSGQFIIPALSIVGALVPIPLDANTDQVLDVTGVTQVTSSNTTADTFDVIGQTSSANFGNATDGGFGGTPVWTDGVERGNTKGDVKIIGGTSASWASVSTAATTHDYMAVVFSPNYVGDRSLITVGALPGTTAGVDLQILKTSPASIIRTTTFVLSTALTTGDYVPTTNGILTADIALPTDFDPSTSSGQRIYVGIGTYTKQTTDDVYRIDGAQYRALGAVSTAQVKSVSYSGTIDAGTLFMGENAATTVKFSTNPQVSLPTWTSSKKPPTGTGATVLRVAPDFGTTSMAYAGTSGADSAFHVSNNAGVSFDGESLIDADLDTIVDIAVTSDGSAAFVATYDTFTNRFSVWKSATPVSSTSWSRVLSKPTTVTDAILALNPDWASEPVIYLVEKKISGAVYRSSNGGDIFASRTGPAAVPAAVAVEDANVLYLGAGMDIHKSTTGAWTWKPSKSAKTIVKALDVPQPDHLLVGGDGSCSYSTDGASTFSKITATSGVTYDAIAADEDYADNNNFYVGDSDGILSRFTIGESTSLASLSNPNNNPIIGVAQNNKALYVMQADQADRTLDPRKAPGTVKWDSGTAMDTGLTPSVDFFDAVGNVLYSANAATPTLWAYDDYLATTKPVLVAPGDGATVAIDPVTGRADLVTLAWNAMGSGTGLVTHYQVQIAEKDAGWGAGSVLPSPTEGKAVASATSPQVTLGPAGAALEFSMLANVEYIWRVRAFNQVSTDAIKSNWADSHTVKVQSGTVVMQPHAGPVILGPQGGATTGLTPGISWAPYSGATKYQVILATDPGLKNRVAGTPVFVDAPAWQPTAPLAYDTYYFFAITAVEPTVSPQAIGTFTTLAKAAPPTPPVVIPPQLAPQITLQPPVVTIPPAAAPITPAFIWAIVIIGAILIIAVLVLIVRTRRPM